MARTYTVTVTVILNNGMQFQSNYFDTLTHERMSDVESEVETLVGERLANSHPDAQWFLAVIAGSDYGFVVKKYNGDGTFANELGDQQ